VRPAQWWKCEWTAVGATERAMEEAEAVRVRWRARSRFGRDQLCLTLDQASLTSYGWMAHTPHIARSGRPSGNRMRHVKVL